MNAHGLPARVCGEPIGRAGQPPGRNISAAEHLFGHEVWLTASAARSPKGMERLVGGAFAWRPEPA